MVPPSFTPDSRLPPHQQHRDFPLVTAVSSLPGMLTSASPSQPTCFPPPVSIRYLLSGCSVCSYVFGAQLRDVFVICGIMRLSSAGSFLFSPDITTCSLPSLFSVSVAYTTPSSSLLSRSFSYSIFISINPCGGAVTPALSRSFDSKICRTSSGV